MSELIGFGRWMVDQNVKAVLDNGEDAATVVARITANGYPSVAAGVEAKLAAMSTVTIGRTTYEVEAVTGHEHVAYRLYGPRGARYTAMRNHNDRRNLFLVNARNFGSSVPCE